MSKVYDDPKRKAVVDALTSLREDITSDQLADELLAACAACTSVVESEHIDHCMDSVRRRVSTLKRYRSAAKRRSCVSEIAEAVSVRFLREYDRHAKEG